MKQYFRQAVAGTCLLTLAFTPAVGFSQAPLPVPAPVDTGQPIPVPSANQALLSPNQLDGLVAPLALYPDPLVSQILVASTYPLEVVEAYQWLQRNPGLTGPALTQAAAAQNWDPSVQAIVVFPDVLKRLNEDVTWTTSLGNAFLNQQADVMSAIQRMRVSAQQSGRLVSTPQQQVINTTDAGQPVVEIVPTNPEVIYVPVYDPYWVWGPPIYYPYPHWYYPPVFHTGLFFGVGIGIGAFFGAGWGGWGGWGWHPGWGSRTIIVNNTFINRYNYNSRFAGVRGPSVWSHDAFHRGGIPYTNQAVSQRFGSNNFRQNAMASRAAAPVMAPNRSFASPSRPAGMANAAPRQSFNQAPRQSFNNQAPRQSFNDRAPTQAFPNRNGFAGAPARTAPGFNSQNFNTGRSYVPPARSVAPQARSYAPPARSFAPQGRSYAPMARSAAPPYHGGGGSYSSHGGGGGSSSHSSGRSRR
jgi:hypothetical protein